MPASASVAPKPYAATRTPDDAAPAAPNPAFMPAALVKTCERSATGVHSIRTANVRRGPGPGDATDDAQDDVERRDRRDARINAYRGGRP
jgi:hypothetical protein